MKLRSSKQRVNSNSQFSGTSNVFVCFCLFLCSICCLPHSPMSAPMFSITQSRREKSALSRCECESQVYIVLEQIVVVGHRYLMLRLWRMALMKDIEKGRRKRG